MKILNKWGFALLGSLVLGTMMPSLAGAVSLAIATTPSNGVAGVSNVNVNGSGFPTGTILPAAVNIHLAASCGAAILANTSALSVTTIIGSTRRVQFQIPGALATGTYYVSLDGATTAAVPFSSGSSCSAIQVTHTNSTLSACVPGSSLGINAPIGSGPVTAIVPRGYWSSSTTDIRMVALEGAGVNTSIPTTSVVNSCAANQATGQSVCVANDTKVYLIDSAGTLTDTLNSGSTGATGFSGGSCQNCGVAMNSLTNQVAINMGLAGSPSGSGIQILDLNTKTFQTPKPLQFQVAENISIDPTRGYILTPSESNRYNLVQFNSANGVLGTEFNFNPPGSSGEFDSAAEDCTTGIALTAEEFTSNVFIADLTQATFVPGSPGTWSAPSTHVTLPGASFSAGTSGITVAPGSSHLAVVTGEFGGSAFAVLQLPSTSGSGTPTISDFAYVSGICNLSAGFDPHTISAYTSGNDGKAYGVMVGYTSGAPTSLAVLDLAAIMAAPRNAGTNTVAGGQICNTTTPNLVRFVPVP
jgi:hypothetical protein